MRDLPQGVSIVQQLDAAQTVALQSLYNRTWTFRELAHVQRMLEHSLYWAVLDSQEQLIGFARVLTDHTYKALILDVMVEATWRGKGLASALMDRILSDARLAGIRDFELYCTPDMQPFYHRWGFRGQLEVNLMRRMLTPA